mmetsp:Transcript_30095/g.64678  ORF Transcript_30095/g.64678 Transcript_30095/m.64678 type:complete len:286 (-) Transcript_30095:148-1005(-)|eukprot:CAMPEP_0183351788 /NCGR_PEP_ID=MMETSP0164_2-20130417/26252_1 /TAXON_ID=221442 /ORGANISM="Coccolithus pelagicus ssp braarudi, Strain PLY182g" /LENGTH=285 /DNA_ID=CAMNT_0025524059 /DNA_START=244 /DNA_END=1101 /DNA_ORIENTATION=-
MGNLLGGGDGHADPAQISPEEEGELLRIRIKLAAGSDGRKAGLLMRKNVVLHVHADSPAMVAGIHSGDEIISWEGEPLTAAWTASQALSHSSTRGVGGLPSSQRVSADLIVRRSVSRSTAGESSRDANDLEDSSVMESRSEVSEVSEACTLASASVASTTFTIMNSEASTSTSFPPSHPAGLALDLLLDLTSGSGASGSPQGPGLGCKVQENLILDVFPHSAAEAAGLKPGDVVVGWDDVPLNSDFTIRSALFKSAAELARSEQHSTRRDRVVLRVHRPCELQDI